VARCHQKHGLVVSVHSSVFIELTVVIFPSHIACSSLYCTLVTVHVACFC